MKKILAITILLFPITSFAIGGAVQVNHTVQNIQKVGILTRDNMSSVIEYNEGLLSQTGEGSTQIYDLSNSGTNPTQYKVVAPFISNYEATPAGDCEGLVYDNKVKTCILQWTDTGRKEAPVVKTEPTTNLQQTTTISSSNNSELIRSLQLQIIDLLNQIISLINQLNGHKTI